MKMSSYGKRQCEAAVNMRHENAQKTSPDFSIASVFNLLESEPPAINDECNSEMDNDCYSITLPDHLVYSSTPRPSENASLGLLQSGDICAVSSSEYAVIEPCSPIPLTVPNEGKFVIFSDHSIGRNDGVQGSPQKNSTSETNEDSFLLTTDVTLNQDNQTVEEARPSSIIGESALNSAIPEVNSESVEEFASKADCKHPFIVYNCKHDPHLPLSKCFKCNLTSEEERHAIYKSFWQKDIQGQRNFVSANVKATPGETTRKRKMKSLCYYLNSYKVCKSFFLKTLGFNASDSIIRSVFDNIPMDELSLNLGAPPDKRGRHIPSNKHDESLVAEVKNFVESFKPCVSHYRISHAPNRRYLPNNLSIRSLFDEFIDKKKNDDVIDSAVCSRPWFSRIIHEMNISFQGPHQDQCPVCEQHKLLGDHDCDGQESCTAYKNIDKGVKKPVMKCVWME